MFETSIFLAKVFGLYFVVISLFMLVRKQIFVSRITDLLESSASRMVMAFMTLIIGILLIVSHNVWVWGWPVVITLFAWLAFIKGILRLYFPDVDKKCLVWFMKENVFYSTGIVSLLLGLFFLWVGFF